MTNLPPRTNLVTKVKVLIYLLVVLGLAGVLLNFLEGKFLQTGKKAATPSGQNANEKQRVIDCAKKLKQDPKTLSQAETRDCLFIGCGDFFR